MRTIGDRLNDLREAFAQRELDQDRNPTEAAFLASKDAWTAGAEVDALLAALAGHRGQLLDVLHAMPRQDLIAFGSVLYDLGQEIARVLLEQTRARQ